MKSNYFVCLFLIFCSSIQAQDLDFGLIGYYRFNNGLIDNSSLGLDGQGSNLVLGEGIEEIPNTAYQYNGQNSSIYFSNDNRGVTDAVTVSAWVKTTSFNRMFVLGKYFSGDDRGYFLTLDDGRAIIGGRNNSGVFTQAVSVNLVNDGNWHHIMGIVDGNLWQIRVDCKLEGIATTNSQNVQLFCSDPMTIGLWHEGATAGDFRWFDGLIDEVRLYDRALSLDEIELVCNEDLVVSIDSPEKETQHSEVAIFPNPGYGLFNIERSGIPVLEFDFDLYHPDGRLLKSGKGSAGQLTLNHLDQGIYFIHVYQDGVFQYVDRLYVSPTP